MPKEVYFIEIYDKTVTGFTTYKRELLSGLYSSNDVQVFDIILESPSHEFSIRYSDGITRFCVPRIKENKEVIIGTLLQLYIENSSDIIFLYNSSPTYSMVKMLRTYFLKSKIVYVIHDFMWATFLCGDINRFKRIINHEENDIKGGLITYLYRDGLNAYSICDKIVCLSQDTYRLLEDFYHVDSSKLIVISNGLKDDYNKNVAYNIRSLYGISDNDKVLLYVGRVSYQKGIVHVLNVFKHVLSVLPTCRLVIIGDIGCDFIAKINPDVRMRVLLLGILPKEYLYEWYRVADAGIQPSYYEQCSYTGIEMKMFGLPIVSSDAFGIKCMFDSSNAVIASIEDEYLESTIYQQNLVNGIIQILTCSMNEKLYLKRQSRKHYENTYTSVQMISKYLSLIRSL